ncbi:MAG: hypothetical protein WD648_03610 [Planctomycetaceae bacterium]
MNLEDSDKIDELRRQQFEQREVAETVANIEAGMQEYLDGKGIPLEEAFRDVRKRLGISD